TYAHGTLYNGDTNSVFTGGLIRAVGEHVTGSPYAITQGSLSAGTDYTISFTGANFTITPRGLSVSADPQTKVYGASDPALTYAHGTLYNGDTNSVFTGGLIRAVGEHVTGSPYAITQGSLSAGTDYTISFTGANFTITPRGLSVSADGQTKVYGASDPALTYTHGTLYNGDTDSVFSGGLVRASGEHVAGSPYAISQGSLSAGTDYTVSFTGASLTITPRGLSVTADGQTKVYGASDPALTYTHGTLYNGDTDTVFTGGLVQT